MSDHTLALTLVDGKTETRQEITLSKAVIAGWTGRDPVAVEKHIRELEELGIKRPASTPIFYRVAAARVTTSPEIEVIGDRSGGEVEFVVLRAGGTLWVGVGSDHTDREVEAYGVTVSKQMCDKPIGSTFWRFDDVAPHWDRLALRSWLREGDSRTAYQEGSVTAMLDPRELLARFEASDSFPDGGFMSCGTLAAIGGVRPTLGFDMELYDPVLDRRITHSYTAKRLPILG